MDDLTKKIKDLQANPQALDAIIAVLDDFIERSQKYVIARTMNSTNIRENKFDEINVYAYWIETLKSLKIKVSSPVS